MQFRFIPIGELHVGSESRCFRYTKWLDMCPRAGIVTMPNSWLENFGGALQLPFPFT